MKKLDKVCRVFNIVLGIVYVPLSLLSWLLQMASESTIGATNPVYITLIGISCVISFCIPFLCVGGILASVKLRKKGYSKLAFCIQFLPLAIFLLNMILLGCAELVPAVL